IHPKASQQKEDKNFNVQKYYQVFSDKFDFIENLSILDLIFNEGPLSYEILKKSIPNQI
ncbi:MAG: WbqC family protein, partial [Bacteroidales bacterium]|nr:WbqC family protein [Bacteroidales bacterium]